MPITYYGDRISANMTRTPEGYLICHNVPIARTGTQIYLARELGLPGDGNRKVTVFRAEDQVFDPAAMASFEGKPVTDEHPPDGLISVDTRNNYIKGTVKNVRRGTDTEADLLLADLVIYDKRLIHEIENGKREVSSGYGAQWVANDDDTLNQETIRGNHVAVVAAGRAGSRVAIHDAKEGKNLMNWRQKILKMFFSDGDFTEEETKEFLETIVETEEEPPKEEPLVTPEKIETPATDQGGDMAAVLAAIESLTAMVAKCLPQQTAPDNDPMSRLEQELTDEESETIEPEKEDEPDEPAMDALAVVRKLKPVVAQLPLAEQKTVADSLGVILRQQRGAKSPGGDGVYAMIAAGTASHAKALNDAAPGAAEPSDQTELGKKWREQYQPHYRGKQ